MNAIMMIYIAIVAGLTVAMAVAYAVSRGAERSDPKRAARILGSVWVVGCFVLVFLPAFLGLLGISPNYSLWW